MSYRAVVFATFCLLAMRGYASPVDADSARSIAPPDEGYVAAEGLPGCLSDSCFHWVFEPPRFFEPPGFFHVSAAQPQTLAFANPGAQTVGTPLTLVATATSGLAVGFVSTTTSVCTVSGTTATFLAVGTCSITATQAGNATYAAAPPVSQSFAVGAAGASPAGATIVVDATAVIAPISARQLGINLGYIGADVTSTNPNVFDEVQSIGAKFLRWPGGTASDTYHWAGPVPYVAPNVHTACSVTDYDTLPWTYAVDSPAYPPSNTWPNFQRYIAVPGHYETAITVDYGTNPTCNGGGDPNEAAAWVAYAKADDDRVEYWTVGNEQYGGWEDDLHAANNLTGSCGGTGCHEGAVYVASMNGPTGYYQRMKAANPNAQVGAVIENGWQGAGASDGGLAYWDGWDAAVLGCAAATGATACASTQTGASFDFVELHWYAQQPGYESDAYLLDQATTDFDAQIVQLRGELAATGHANTPIMLGEFNSVAYAPGKQSMSIVNALFVGMMYGEILKNEVDIATLWFGLGGTQNCGNNDASSLYGWQNFGGYDAVANNVAYSWNDCTSNAGPTIVPEGTIFPNGQAVRLVTQFANDGEHLLATTVAASLTNVRAYSATHGTGYNLMLFNLDRTNTASVAIGVSHAAAATFVGTTTTYGKAQYDDSQNNVWTGAVSQNLGTVGPIVALALPPWSITVLQLQVDSPP